MAHLGYYELDVTKQSLITFKIKKRISVQNKRRARSISRVSTVSF